MRITLLVAFLLCSLLSFSQNRWNASFKIKTNFILGQSQTYQVKEFFKIDNIFIGFKSTVESIVNFKVIDTSNGGYWIRYTMSTLAAKSKQDKSVFIKNELMDNIKLYVFAKDGNFLLDSLSYHKSKNRIADKLDSIANEQTFDKNTTRYIKYLQAELKKDAGLGSLLAPLLLWQQYYISGEFKKFRLTGSAEAQNILSQKEFSGVIDKEWVSTTRDSTVELNAIFTGDPVQTAKFYKAFYEQLIIINNKKIGKLSFPPEMRYVDNYFFKNTLTRTFPIFLSKKNVSEYFFRSVVKTEMNELDFN